MPASVFHALSMTTPDDPAYENKPSDWNSSHLVSFNAVGSEISNAFGNGGGVTFGYDGTNITASAPAGGGLTNINISAGTTSNNLSALTFNNSNGVSFGLNGSVITATVATNYQSQGAYLTTAMASNRGSDFVQATAVFAGTNASGTIASNGISVSVGNYITTARASNDAVGLNTALTAGPLAWTVNSNGISLNAGSAAGTTSGFTGGASISGSLTHNTAGLAVSLSHPAWITTAMASNAVTISNIRVSAGTTSNLLSALTFSNANGVSFGIDASTITASVNTSYRASNDAIGLNTAQSNVTWTVNSSGISLDARGYAGTGTTFNGANISGSMTVNSDGVNLSLSAVGGGVTNQTGPNIAAGTQTATSGTVVFSNSNGITFGMSNSSIVTASYNSTQFAGTGTSATNASITLNSNGLAISVAAPGGGITMTGYAPDYVHVQALAASVSAGTMLVAPMPVIAPFQFNNFMLPVQYSNATNSSGSLSLTLYAGIYTRNNSTLSLIHSSSSGFSVTNSGTQGIYSSIGGLRVLPMGWTSTVTAGNYWIGIGLSSATAGANCSISWMVASQQASNVSGVFGFGTNASRGIAQLGEGRFGGTTAAPPSSIAITNIEASASQYRRPPVYFFQSGTF